MSWSKVTLVLLLVCGSAVAGDGKRPVRLIWLPTRAAGPAATTEASAVAGDVAAAIGGELVVATPGPESARMSEGLARAAQLLGDGQVDEAADTYDAAIVRGRSEVLRLGDPAELLRGVVARIGIAIARGEAARARELSTWLLRVDPTFTLDASEARPSLSAELDAARGALGQAAPPVVADLGDCRPSSDAVIAARSVRADAIEMRRIDSCRLGDAVIVTVGGDRGAATRALAGPDMMVARPERTPAPQHHRTWLWFAVGAVVAGAAGGTWFYIDRKETREVIPHW